MEMSGQLHAPAALPPRKKPLDTHCIGGWVGPKSVQSPPGIKSFIMEVKVKLKFLSVLNLSPGHEDVSA
jgi:hypothetical protein